MNWLRSRIRKSPQRALVAGKAVFLAGCILILGAVFARASLANLNAEREQARQPGFRTLAEAWPQYPTWIVPEGPVGFTLAGVLVLAGMVVTVIAGEAVKQDKEQRPLPW